MAKKIYLSPSNQNNNTYATGNTNEMVQCNKIAEAAKKALERCGFSVKKAPQGQSMYTTVEQSNSWGADLHIPIHTNAYNGKVTGGTLVMLYSMGADNVKAGECILNAVGPISPGPDYTLRSNPELYELNATVATATYTEVEFHDTVTGAQWIINHTEKIGAAIAKGVCNLFDVAYLPEGSGGSSGGGTITDNLYRVRKSWADVKSQIGAFSVLDYAKAMADKNPGYYVFDGKGAKIYTPASSASGKLTLKDVPLYISATAKEKSTTVSGTYYRWDNDVVSGRVRITNSQENIGKAGQVTGWIDLQYTVS